MTKERWMHVGERWKREKGSEENEVRWPLGCRAAVYVFVLDSSREVSSVAHRLSIPSHAPKIVFIYPKAMEHYDDDDFLWFMAFERTNFSTSFRRLLKLEEKYSERAFNDARNDDFNLINNGAV